jgi:hypothetical protein
MYLRRRWILWWLSVVGTEVERRRGGARRLRRNIETKIVPSRGEGENDAPEQSEAGPVKQRAFARVRSECLSDGDYHESHDMLQGVPVNIETRWCVSNL